MVFIVRHRKARELDARGDALLVYKGYGRETLSDENLSPFDVIGHQKRVRCAARGRNRIAGSIDHKMLVRSAGADAAHISDVVVQRSQDGMAPIVRRDRPFEAPAAQNVLDAKGDQ